MKGKLCIDAPVRFKKLSDELDVVYREVDEFWLALKPSQIANLEAAKRLGQEYYGVTGYEIISPEKIRELEPHVTRNAVAAFYVRDLGVIYPPEWTFALTENAVQNGVYLHLNTRVADIKKEGDFAYVIRTQQDLFRTRYIQEKTANNRVKCEIRAHRLSV